MGAATNLTRAMRRVQEAHRNYAAALRYAATVDGLDWQTIERITVGDKADIIASMVTTGLALEAQSALVSTQLEMPHELETDPSAITVPPSDDGASDVDWVTGHRLAEAHDYIHMQRLTIVP